MGKEEKAHGPRSVRRTPVEEAAIAVTMEGLAGPQWWGSG